MSYRVEYATGSPKMLTEVLNSTPKGWRIHTIKPTESIGREGFPIYFILWEEIPFYVESTAHINGVQGVEGVKG